MQLPAAITAREPACRRATIVAGVLVVLACAWRAIYRFDNGDFKLHWEFGRRILAGEFLYAGGHHATYPPFWAVAHSPFALVPMPVAKALFLPVGLGALVLLLWTLRKLVPSAIQPGRTRAFWAATVALVLVGRFVIRDLAEVGVNTVLVALTWLAIYLWKQRRDGLAGISLGLAIALKCTPVIFAAFFLWKRQWRMALCTGMAALAFTLMPVLWQGPSSYREHITAWATNAWRGFGGADPSVGVAGAEPLQNMSLRPALARYLIHLPDGHPGRADHSLYLDVLDLPPAIAGQIIRTILIVLVGGFLWWSREAPTGRDDSRLLWEFGAVSILMLLLSPITWGQHCVALLPPCYFIATLWVARGGLPRWMMILLAFYILFVPVLSRDLIGRKLSLLLSSYHVETFAIVGLLAVVLGCRRFGVLSGLR